MKKITFTLLFICLILLTSCSLVKREEIGMQAFAYTKLKYIVIPSSVTKIDSSAFMEVVSDFVIYTNFNSRPSTWGEALTSNIKVYYEGEWEYNENGNPTEK